MASDAHEKPDVRRLKRRCPRLGHEVSFNYCLVSDDPELPCWKTFDCWWEIFNVNDWLKQHLPEAEYRRLALKKPGNKIASILEIMENAKKRTGK